MKPNQPKTVTVKNLSLLPDQKQNFEPYLETNKFEDHIEIVIETPGVEQGSVIMSLSEDGRNLRISIETQFKKFEREIQLPYVSSMEGHTLDINNGIVSIQILKL
jgi:HSP20 family molecular chaperone IbpA